MKIVHFSDTHLGFQAYDVVNELGVNAREQDIYDAFTRVIDRILVLQPAAVIHSGDFFHRPSPSNRALTFALEQLRRLCDAKIPIYIIAGNHETPKTVITSPILRALRSMDCVFPIFNDRWECFELDHIAIHGLPHINDLRFQTQELERLQAVPGKFNLLMLHTSFGKKYLMEEYGEQVFPDEFDTKLLDFQYIALGHWHNFQQTSGHPNAWYPGSTERLSDTEAGFQKGFMVLDIAGPDQFTSSFEAIETRSWLKFDIVDCKEKSVQEIRNELEQFQELHNFEGSILSLTFHNVKVEQSLELSNMRLREIFPESFQLLIKRRVFSDNSFLHGLEANQFDSLDKIFGDYIRSKYGEDEETARKLTTRALSYFNTIV